MRGADFSVDQRARRDQDAGAARQVVQEWLTSQGVDTGKQMVVDVPGQGYVVVQVDKVLPRDPKLADSATARQQYAGVFGAAESQAYYEALKKREKAEITATPQQMAGSTSDDPVR